MNNKIFLTLLLALFCHGCEKTVIAYPGNTQDTDPKAPEGAINWLIDNDAENNPSIRQYGAVTLINNNIVSDSYTGTNCFDYKNHIIGDNYAIQGNILLGQSVLDSMETRFLNTTGSNNIILINIKKPTW